MLLEMSWADWLFYLVPIWIEKYKDYDAGKRQITFFCLFFRPGCFDFILRFDGVQVEAILAV